MSVGAGPAGGQVLRWLSGGLPGWKSKPSAPPEGACELFSPLWLGRLSLWSLSLFKAWQPLSVRPQLGFRRCFLCGGSCRLLRLLELL